MNPCQYDHDHLCTSMEWKPLSPGRLGLKWFNEVWGAYSNGVFMTVGHSPDMEPDRRWVVAALIDSSHENAEPFVLAFDTPHHALLQAESWMLALGEESGLRDDLLLPVFQEEL